LSIDEDWLQKRQAAVTTRNALYHRPGRKSSFWWERRPADEEKKRPNKEEVVRGYRAQKNPIGYYLEKKKGNSCGRKTASSRTGRDKAIRLEGGGTDSGRPSGKKSRFLQAGRKKQRKVQRVSARRPHAGCRQGKAWTPTRKLPTRRGRKVANREKKKGLVLAVWRMA